MHARYRLLEKAHGADTIFFRDTKVPNALMYLEILMRPNARPVHTPTTHFDFNSSSVEYMRMSELKYQVRSKINLLMCDILFH